jgi:hypothetical protein
MMRLRLPILILTSAFCAITIAAEKGYHHWIDDQGQSVYSQFAPADNRESEIIAPPPPPAESPEAAKARLDQQLQAFEDNREDEELAGEKTAAADQEARLRQQRCESARSNLKVLDGPPRQLIQTDEGIRRLTPEQRQARREEMQKIIDTDCK